MASTPLEFGGEEDFEATPAELFAALTDFSRLARIIPDLASFEATGDRTAQAVVRPGFSFLRGTLRLGLSLEDLQPPEAAQMRVHAKGIGVEMQIASRLSIVPAGQGARLLWSAQVSQLKGLVTSVSPALIRGAADQVIRHSWQQVRRELAG